MNWRPVRRLAYRRLIDFLKVDEWRHIALTSRLKKAGEVCFGSVSDGRIWLREKDGTVNGCLYISQYGVVLPVFKPEELTHQEERVLRNLLLSRQSRIFSVMGMSNRVHFVEKLLGSSPLEMANYRMLTHTPTAGDARIRDSSITVRTAGLPDLEFLWPLEKSYLREEVLREGHELNEFSTRRMFSRALQDQMIYCATLNGRPVAKAGTNARGWFYDQIGGVFVVPEHRKQGFGRRVTEELLEAIGRERRHACLFVKESNRPARQLYTALGFNDRGGFKISYWK